MEVNDTHLNIEPSILEEDIVEDLLRETADPIPIGPGHWQGVNNMYNKFTPCNKSSIIMEGGKEDIKLKPFIAPVNQHLSFSKLITHLPKEMEVECADIVFVFLFQPGEARAAAFCNTITFI